MTLRIAASMDHGGPLSNNLGPSQMWNNLGCNLFANGNTRFENATPSPRFTGPYWEHASSTGYWRVDFPGGLFSGNIMWGGFSYYAEPGGTTVGQVFGINRGGTNWAGGQMNGTFGVFHLDWVTGTTYQLKDSNDASIGSSFTISDGAWHHFAFEVDSVGSGTLTFKLDGTAIVTAAAGDYAGASATGDNWHMCFDFAKNTARYDDIIVGDGSGSNNTTIPDDMRIESLVPTGDDSLTGFTSTTFDKVDDPIERDDDTTHSEGSSISDEYTLTTGSISFTPSSIIAAQLLTVARKTGTEVANLRPRIDSGASYYNGTDINLPVSYAGNMYIWELDPDTSLAWTESGVNAVKPSGIIV